MTNMCHIFLFENMTVLCKNNVYSIQKKLLNKSTIEIYFIKSNGQQGTCACASVSKLVKYNMHVHESQIRIKFGTTFKKGCQL